MPVSAQWYDDDKHIVYWKFASKWTWAEYYQQRTLIYPQIELQPHIVDVIVDVSETHGVPPGVMTHARAAATYPPSNLGLTVFVGLAPMLRAFYDMFRKLYAGLSGNLIDMVVVESVDEALEAIYARREKK